MLWGMEPVTDPAGLLTAAGLRAGLDDRTIGRGHPRDGRGGVLGGDELGGLCGRVRVVRLDGERGLAAVAEHHHLGGIAGLDAGRQVGLFEDHPAIAVDVDGGDLDGILADRLQGDRALFV